MAWRQRIRLRFSQWLERLRLRLAEPEALAQLAALGIVSGVLAGAVIIAFRLLIETVQAHFMPGADPENFEGLSAVVTVLLPLGAGLFIGLVFHWLPTAGTQVGIVHVMERLAYHQGHLPLRNAVAQFAGAALSIMGGHSVGREGPSVHLGAASGSLLGQGLGLPNNSIRVLVGCGIAAAIAASFNTPLAGVIFAMEVVMMEYTLAGFMPVILAAVSATTLTRLVFGSAPAFAVPSLQLASLGELPWVLLLGLGIGALAAAFIYLLGRVAALTGQRPIWLRFGAAGLLTGLCALAAPQIMGIGYDTVNAALLSQIGATALLLMVVFKLLATTAGLGLGLPGGLIGPTLFIGAAAGGLFGLWAQQGYGAAASAPGYYALLGMGAMMGATLQAPLAALTAMLELTANPNILLPGMLAVIVAGMTASEVFRQPSVYLVLMRARGLDYRNDPIAQSLRRQGVASAMARQFVILPAIVDIEQARAALADKPLWVIVERDRQRLALMPAVDLARQLQEQATATSQETTEPAPTSTVELLEIPAQRLQTASIHLQASLQEALAALQQSGAEALCVVRPTAPGIERVYGVLTRQDIEAGYKILRA